MEELENTGPTARSREVTSSVSIYIQMYVSGNALCKQLGEKMWQICKMYLCTDFYHSLSL